MGGWRCSAAPGPAVPATTTGGTVTSARSAEQQRVGLRLDVLEPGGVQRGAAVLVREQAPELRHELRVGLVATEDPHHELAGRRRGPTSRSRVLGCFGRRCTSSASHAELAERRRHLRGRGSPTRRPEGEVHECRERPPERDRGERAVGQRGAEVERRDRDEQHEQLPQPPHRAGQVGRRDRDHGDDHRQAHGRERRRVVRRRASTTSSVCFRLAFSTTMAPIDPTEHPRQHAADGQVAGQPPAAGHQRSHDHQSERPQRAERVQETEERLELVRQAVQRREQVAARTPRGRPGARWRRPGCRRRSPGGSSRWCAGGTAAPTPGRTSASATRRCATGAGASAGGASVAAVIPGVASQTGAARSRNAAGQRGRTTSGSGWRYSAAAFSQHIARSSSAGMWPQHFSMHELGVGPGAVAVRVVGLDHDVLDADAVAGVDGRRVVDACRTRSCAAARRPGARPSPAP